MLRDGQRGLGRSDSCITSGTESIIQTASSLKPYPFRVAPLNERSSHYYSERLSVKDVSCEQGRARHFEEICSFRKVAAIFIFQEFLQLLLGRWLHSLETLGFVGFGTGGGEEHLG